jgi:hypothetical protein
MKKLISLIASVLMVGSMASCGSGTTESSVEESTSVAKQYVVGDTQKVKGVSLTVTNVESGLYCGDRKSENGSWVKVYFTMQNENDEPYKVFYVDFSLNDTYTVRETTYRLTDIQSGGFALVKGNTYDFYTIFDCKYEHTQADMVFEWEKGLFDTRRWVI